mmetsp:Transcript_120563/g.384949  ORF Transcript_120563/g.384949 Transcript_120563/m.384949 type:complete len:239 (-) Transcript_120563:4651-5367(-)
MAFSTGFGAAVGTAFDMAFGVDAFMLSSKASSAEAVAQAALDCPGVSSSTKSASCSTRFGSALLLPSRSDLRASSISLMSSKGMSSDARASLLCAFVQPSAWIFLGATDCGATSAAAAGPAAVPSCWPDDAATERAPRIRSRFRRGCDSRTFAWAAAEALDIVASGARPCDALPALAPLVFPPGPLKGGGGAAYGADPGMAGGGPKVPSGGVWYGQAAGAAAMGGGARAACDGAATEP